MPNTPRYFHVNIIATKRREGKRSIYPTTAEVPEWPEGLPPPTPEVHKAKDDDGKSAVAIFHVPEDKLDAVEHIVDEVDHSAEIRRKDLMREIRRLAREVLEIGKYAQ